MMFHAPKLINVKLSSTCKILFFIFLFTQINLQSKAQLAQVTELYTDFGGYWKSSSTAINATQPNLSHNVLAFTYNSVVYSTNVNNSALTSHSIGFTTGEFKALPVSSIGGTVISSGSTFISIPSYDDGVLSGTKLPLPSVRMNDVLTDGLNGLNIGTGVTNIPTSASMTFPVSNIDTPSINDAKPDILYTQVAAIGGNPDTLYFVNSSGVKVGNVIIVSWGSVSSVGNYTCDLYTLTNNASCDAATVTGVNVANNQKEIRLAAFKLSEFGITSANSSSVANLRIRPGGSSDPAFAAYNSDAFIIATPVITTQPQTQIICPGTGQNAVFTVAATGSSLSYQWKKNGTNISGATGSTFTITNVTASDAGTYEVIVSNAAGFMQSTLAYLNTVIGVQPSPVTQTIATGNSVTLSVTANNATGYQWKRGGVDISGATSSSLVLNPLTTTNGGVFTVQVINSAQSGCTNLLSTSATVVPVTTLYSKNTNLGTAANWTVNADGSNGSSPVNFTRTEHTFIVRSNASTTIDLSIAGTLDVKDAVVTITPGTALTTGRIIRSGTTGTITGSSTSDLTIGSTIVTGNSDIYFTSGSQLLKNCTIASGGNVTLNTPLNITAGSSAGTLTVNSSGTLNTSDNLTLKSDANGTARVGNSAGTINGQVTIERYIPARRAWRLMAAPVAATNAPTINAAWQEAATASTQNTTPGFGTHLTGGTTVNGYDQSPTNSGSIYFYNTNKWTVPGNLYTTPISTYNGYIVFIRGNRAYDITSTTPNTTPTTTILRMKGLLNQGTQQAKTVTATGLTLIGNPFASPINFTSVIASSTNVNNRLWVWDPTLAGQKGIGAFVTLDWNGTSYTATPASSMTNIIQSGQAFFVESADGASSGSVVINESHKNSTTTNLPFGRPVNTDSRLVINLNIFNDDKSIAAVDGILERFHDSYTNEVDRADALKMKNIGESMSILTEGKTLAIERRTVPGINDTIHLNMATLKNITYELEIVPQNFAGINRLAYLTDNFTNTVTLINSAETFHYKFDVGTDPLSKAADRFNITFKPGSVLAVRLDKIKAALTSPGVITVDWGMENEDGINYYELEKANNENIFSTISKVSSLNGGAVGSAYSFLDKNPIAGENIYRVRVTSMNGDVTYSKIVRVNYLNTNSVVTIYPNPVKENLTMKITTKSADIVSCNIIDKEGKIVKKKKANITVGSNSTGIDIKELATGSYNLSVQGKQTKNSLSFIKQ